MLAGFLLLAVLSQPATVTAAPRPIFVGRFQAPITRQDPTVFVRASSMWSIWRVQVNPDGTVDASAQGRPVARTLTSEQRVRFRSLIAALAKEKTAYEFGKRGLEQTTFTIDVTIGQDVRRYVVREPIGEDSSRTELRPALEVVRFLHELLASKGAIAPPKFP